MRERLPLNVVRRIGVAVLLCGAVSGCGFLFSHGPPPGHESLSTIHCTESKTGSRLDILWGAASVVGAALGASQGDRVALRLTIGGVWAGVYGASAASGFRKANRCAEARRQLEERRMRGNSQRTPNF